MKQTYEQTKREGKEKVYPVFKFRQQLSHIQIWVILYNLFWSFLYFWDTLFTILTDYVVVNRSLFLSCFYYSPFDKRSVFT
jgi:hypothetical protein